MPVLAPSWIGKMPFGEMDGNRQTKAQFMAISLGLVGVLDDWDYLSVAADTGASAAGGRRNASVGAQAITSMNAAVA